MTANGAAGRASGARVRELLRGRGSQRMRAMVLVLAGAMLAELGAAAEDNLVANAGFEEPEQGWSLSTEAARTTDRPHDGQACLKISREDREAYTLTSQVVRLQPGRPYRIAAWIRTEQVTEGQAGGATICLEWTKGGAYLGGEYPKGVWGTQDWTLVEAVAKVPPDADPAVRITCYLRRKATGTAWFDDLEVALVTDYPPVESVFCHAYRRTTAGEPVRVGAELALDWAGLDASAPVRLHLRDAAGQVLARLEPARLDTRLAEFVLPTEALAPGEYTLACGLEDAAGRLTAERTCALRRVDQHPPRYAYIDQHKRLIVDGRPFFPLGTYWNTHYHRNDHTPEQRAAIYARYPNSRDRKLLDLYAQSPFNCLMPYDSWSWTTEDLDEVAARGLKVIFSVKDSYHGICNAYGLKSPDEERGALEREVRRVGQHPAIIAWYINDEVPPEEPRLRLHQQWMEELDPGRPTWAVSYHHHTEYVGTCDVYGMDRYPVPWTEPASVLRQAQAAAGAGASWALWHVPQISDTGTYGDIHKSRPPTLQEMRAMAWMCIAAGANGLVFYSFFDLIRAEDVQPFEPRWADITTMAREIRDLEPVLLSVEPAPQPETVDDAAGQVAWRLYAHEGSLYLVTVNSGTGTASARFVFPRPVGRAETVLGDAPAVVDGRQVALEYAPLEVKILRLTP